MGRTLELCMVLLFITLVEFYKCNFGANVIDFEISKNVVVIIFSSPELKAQVSFLGHLSHSGDLLLWVGVRRRPSCVVRRASCVVR